MNGEGLTIYEPGAPSRPRAPRTALERLHEARLKVEHDLAGAKVRARRANDELDAAREAVGIFERELESIDNAIACIEEANSEVAS